MSEDKVGYAEGIDRTEARLQMIDAILVIVDTKITELERRVKKLEEMPTDRFYSGINI